MSRQRKRSLRCLHHDTTEYSAIESRKDHSPFRSAAAAVITSAVCTMKTTAAGRTGGRLRGRYRSRAAAERTGPPRKVFVGRVRESGPVAEYAAETQDGRAEPVVIAGEAGIGKGSLARRFAASLPTDVYGRLPVTSRRQLAERVRAERSLSRSGIH